MEAQPKTFGNKAAQQRDAGTLLRSPDLEPQGFTSVPNWLKDVHGLSHHSKLAFVYLLQYSWQDGQCFPGLDTLAADLEVERHTAARYLKELEIAGLISIERRGQGLTNVYHLRAWRPSDSLDGTVPCHQGIQDGTEMCHQGDQDGTKMCHPDGTEMYRQDGTEMCHNKDTVTKTQITTTGVPDVMSNNVETSARKDDSRNKQRARAREAPHSLQGMDPLPDWVIPLAQRIYEHWGGDPAEGIPAYWCECLWQNLRDCTDDERHDFSSYVLSNGILRGISSPRGVCTVLSQDAKHWKLRGKPSSKNSVPAPKVPAHIQWERNRSHKPKKDTPERTARIFADLRKYKGEEFAKRWLAEQNDTGT